MPNPESRTRLKHFKFKEAESNLSPVLRAWVSSPFSTVPPQVFLHSTQGFCRHSLWCRSRDGLCKNHISSRTVHGCFKHCEISHGDGGMRRWPSHVSPSPHALLFPWNISRPGNGRLSCTAKVGGNADKGSVPEEIVLVGLT